MRGARFGLLTVLLQNSATSALLSTQSVAAFSLPSPRFSSQATCRSGDAATVMSSAAEKNHWEGMWSRGLKPGEYFDAARSSQCLIDVLSSWEETAKTRKCRMLVPGCGRGYDVVAASKVNFDALGLDISPTAVKAAEEFRDSQGQLSGKAEFSTTDFFTFPESGVFDLVFDYTFLCAIHPSTREAWAQNMKRIIKPGGELVTLIFPIRPPDDNGPPYAMNTALVKGLLEPQG